MEDDLDYVYECLNAYEQAKKYLEELEKELYLYVRGNKPTVEKVFEDLRGIIG